MNVSHSQFSFEELMLPHMGAAYNLALWITRNSDDAFDVVQDSYLRALRFFHSYRGGSARAWFLSIVRTTSLNAITKRRSMRTVPLLDEVMGDGEHEDAAAFIDDRNNPEAVLIQLNATKTLDELIAALPLDFREVVLLRDIEELSYKEIAEVIGSPIGTVMSRLARARKALQKHWGRLAKEGATS